MAELKEMARRIFQETLAAIDIQEAMRQRITRTGAGMCVDDRRIGLQGFSSVKIVAMGKAAHAMTSGLMDVLGPSLRADGVVSAPEKPRVALPGLEYFAGGHPVPNAESWSAAGSILELLHGCDEKTLVFFLLSGGGSALVEKALDAEAALAEIQELNRALVTCGASIDAINAVRKHFSAVKGGRLAVAAGKATKITLAVSDVPAGKESALSSGPTLPDPTTWADVEQVMQEYGLEKRLPARLRKWMLAGKSMETPKPGDAVFTNAKFVLLLGMHELFHRAHHAAEAAGCVACCDNSTDDWPVEKAAEELLRQLAEWKGANPGQRVALIADGEVSSPVTGKGIGGRNAAFVLACVEKIAGRDIAVLSAGTDGIDGNSPAAGAVADGATRRRAGELGMDPREYFARSDAFSLFHRMGDAVVTGPTGNNLRDLRILISE